MEKEILEFLSDGKGHDFLEIVNHLGLTKESDELVAKKLIELTNNYDVYCTKKNRFMLYSFSDEGKNFVKGKYIGTDKDFGFVVLDDKTEDIFVHNSKANGAMDGDTVLVKITKQGQSDKKREGKIIKILSRDIKNKAGVVYHKNGYVMVTLNDKRFKNDLILEGNYQEISRLVDGDIVEVSFSDDKKVKNLISVHFEKRRGHINDPGSDIVSIMVDYEIDEEFPTSVLEQLKTIPTSVSENDLKGRRDLRNEMIFTIDGDDTKDIDDAISVKRLDNGNWLLGVHIADVSYYVRENSPLDVEARNRGTSVYLADRVVPMLPHQLSNGICSLNPNVDRLAISCEMEIDNNGNLVSQDIFPSVIKSKIQMTYKKVNAFLEEGIVSDGYENFTEMLSNMKMLSGIIRNNKIKRGSIDFDTDEAKIVVNEDGKAIDILKRDRGVGEKLIEDFMIMANETVASQMFYMDLPSLYRVHGFPDSDRLKKFLSILSNLGISLKADLRKMKPKVIQGIVNELKKYPIFRVLSTKLLSCMDKAIYDPNNIGHFGIASTCYTHFTSPIRRYPDLMIHRMLRSYFFEKDGITEEKIRHFKEILTEIAAHSSERERASVDCEREVDSMKMAEYMSDHIGEEFIGMISGVTKNGFFVQLDNLVEGMVLVESLDKFYEYNSQTETLVSNNSRDFFQIGQVIKVKVVRASIESRQVDFEFIERVDVNEKEKIKKY